MYVHMRKEHYWIQNEAVAAWCVEVAVQGAYRTMERYAGRADAAIAPEIEIRNYERGGHDLSS